MIELDHGPWSAQLRPDVGGALTRLRWNGIDVLRPAPPWSDPPAIDAVRSSAAYPMLPWCNRIRDGRLRWDGRDYSIARNFPPDTRAHPHPLHGIGWLRRWKPVDVAPDSARLEYEFDASADAASHWPFAHRGRQRIALDDDRFTLELGLSNTSAHASMPAGLGWHPFFCIEDGATVFCPVLDYWRTDDDRLPIARDKLPAGWRFAVEAQSVGTLELDHCFTGWNGTAQLDRPARGLRVSICASPLLRHVVLYRRAGTDWLAVEPMSHMTDAFNRAERGEHDTGTLRLAPGEAASATITIRCEPR